MTEQEFMNNIFENKDWAEIIIETKDGEEYKIVAGQLLYIKFQDNIDIYTFSSKKGNIFETDLKVLAWKVYFYLTIELDKEIVFVYGG